jgi:hypothetical protein
MPKKIGLAGLLSTEADLKEFIRVEKMLADNPTVEVHSLRKMYMELIKDIEGSKATVDDILDVGSDIVDIADVVLIILPHSLGDGWYYGMTAVGMLIGISWERGTPVIVYSPDYIDDSNLKTTPLVQKATQAYIHSFEELQDYDWTEIPYKRFRGRALMDVAFTKDLLAEFADDFDEH